MCIGRYKNGSRMDNGWRNVRAMQDPKKKTHGIILCLNARQELCLPVIHLINDLSSEEDELPVCIAWTHIETTGAEGKAYIMSQVRRAIELMPRAVNFPVRSYGKGQFGDGKIDFAVLELLMHMKTQAARHMLFGHQEASMKLMAAVEMAY